MSRIYLVENEEAVINIYAKYWIVKANSAPEAIDKVYRDALENFGKSRLSGLYKYKLTATRINDKMLADNGVYMIA